MVRFLFYLKFNLVKKYLKLMNSATGHLPGIPTHALKFYQFYSNCWQAFLLKEPDFPHVAQQLCVSCSHMWLMKCCGNIPNISWNAAAPRIPGIFQNERPQLGPCCTVANFIILHQALLWVRPL